MQLIGQSAQHYIFGTGTVTDWDGATITIRFPAGEKKFIYPDAFFEFLRLDNETAQKKVRKLLAQREAAKKAQRQAAQELQEKRGLLQNLKISPQSQAVFDVAPDQRERLFSQWSISTGLYISGAAKGEPRIPERLKPNSICLFTERVPGEPEKERRITGAFMVEEDFLGSYCRDGAIQAHPIYRLRLRPERRLPFWPYVTEEPEGQRWGRAPLKYMNNKVGEKILFDIKELSLCDGGKERAEEFYQYYCKLNRLQPKGK